MNKLIATMILAGALAACGDNIHPPAVDAGLDAHVQTPCEMYCERISLTPAELRACLETRCHEYPVDAGVQ